MPTYVIGHKNPDTDAICSALAYADFLRRTGLPEAEAACCGEIPQRTAYALQRAGVTPPKLVMDVRPTAGQVSCRTVVSASIADSIVESFERMRAKGLHSIPVLDGEQRVQGMLSLLKVVDLLLPNSENKPAARLINSSLARVVKGVSGEIQHAFELEREEQLTLLVGALSYEKFAARLQNYRSNRLLIVVGDRPTVQKAAIEYGVRSLVITGGNRLSDDLLGLAIEHQTTVVLSPYDTATTTLLIKCAKSISDAIDREYLSFVESTPLELVLEQVEHTAQSVFPVVGENHQLRGIIAKSDLIDPPRTKLILVDHNEFAQAVSGIDQAEILEVLDHHRLGGGVSSKYPIRFINEPVGSTCTIVAMMYLRAELTPSASVAILLASGIISDTLHLSSPTTTETDREMLAWMQVVSGLDLAQYTEDFFAAGSLLQSATPGQAVRADCKEYTENTWRFVAAQVEEQTLDDFWKHRTDLAEALEGLRQEKSLDFACLLITDITRHYSVLLVAGSHKIIMRIGYPKLDDQLFELKGIVSRKKQLLPHLMQVMGQIRRA